MVKNMFADSSSDDEKQQIDNSQSENEEDEMTILANVQIIKGHEQPNVIQNQKEMEKISEILL